MGEKRAVFNQMTSHRSKHFRMHPVHDTILNRYFGGSEAAQAREDLEVLDALIRTGSVEIADLELTPDAASLIVDACRGMKFDVSYMSTPLFSLINSIEDAIKLKRLDERHSVNRDELLEKLRLLSPLGGLALIHMARLFWAHNSDGRHLSIAEVFPTA